MKVAVCKISQLHPVFWILQRSMLVLLEELRNTFLRTHSFPVFAQVRLLGRKDALVVLGGIVGKLKERAVVEIFLTRHFRKRHRGPYAQS